MPRLVLVCASIVALSAVIGDAPVRAQDSDDARPSLALRATPAISFSPTSVLLVGQLRGGPDDYEEFYCATIEWEWGGWHEVVVDVRL